MKYLIVGLGNIGKEYENTRHNMGFIILDALAKASNVFFIDKPYGAITEIKLKSKRLFLLKPSTYMNLSGSSVCYWLKKEKVLVENLLILVDDLSLPFGSLRLKSKGSNAGHNGLKHIQTSLGTNHYHRLRFGIGDYFLPGCQIHYLLEIFSEKEQLKLSKRVEKAIEIIYSFCSVGAEKTMNLFNNK